MVKQRPHSLTFTWTEDIVKDEDTGKMDVVSTSTYTGDCGVFKQSGDRKILASGVLTLYVYHITADHGIGVPVGARVTVEGQDLGVIAVDYTLQKHAELWVA